MFWEPDTIICRCEDITYGEIIDAIDKGATTIDELKHILRVSMGPCQGKGCLNSIRKILAARLGVDESSVRIPKKRPPFMPIKFSAFLLDDEYDC